VSFVVYLQRVCIGWSLWLALAVVSLLGITALNYSCQLCVAVWQIGCYFGVQLCVERDKALAIVVGTLLEGRGLWSFWRRTEGGIGI
jgi:hypothetical protein